MREGIQVIAEITKETEKKMSYTVDHAREEFAAIRTGRAHPAMFAKLTADYYGTQTPLQQLASFQSPEPRTIIITPFDRQAMAAIERSIRDSDLGVNPANDGNSIRVVLPQLTEERRREFIKVARAKAEEGRIAVRNCRRHAIEQIKRLEKDHAVGEDEAVRAEKALDQVTRKHVERIDELLRAKEAELLEI